MGGNHACVCPRCPCQSQPKSESAAILLPDGQWESSRRRVGARGLVKREIAQTVRDSAEVTAELRYLIEVVARGREATGRDETARNHTE